jgi:hypothetical protein
MNIETRRLTKPVYKRQQFLLSFLKELNEPLTATDFQKLLFLYIMQNNLSHYYFVPYLYGAYSIQAAEDMNTLQAMGWLEYNNHKFQYAGNNSSGLSLPFDGFGGSITEQLPKVRGNHLIKLVYEQYPYYAINSRTADSITETEGLARIKDVKENYKNTDQRLFTIGYEGISIEQYLNTLIINNVHVLCDVRSNPLSRKFGFSKSNLQKYLGNIGIEYMHFPELGIRSEKRTNLNSDEDYQNLFKVYKSTLSEYKECLYRLYILLETKNSIALTCFEREPSHCHRHIIRDYLKETYNVKTMDL